MDGSDDEGRHMRILILAILAAGLFAAPAADAAGCAEDQACWNWATMGNHQRGVKVLTFHSDGSVTSARKVVGVCRYNHLWADGRVPYSILVNGEGVKFNRWMRGDEFARSLTDCPWRNR